MALKRPLSEFRLPVFPRRRLKDAAWGAPMYSLHHKNPVAIQQYVVPADQKPGQKPGFDQRALVVLEAHAAANESRHGSKNDETFLVQATGLVGWASNEKPHPKKKFTIGFQASGFGHPVRRRKNNKKP